MNRKDDYFKTCMNKFEQILDIARQEGVEGIIVAGDFFDTPTVPYFVTKRVMELIIEYSKDFYVIPGQHDLRYHTAGINNTPMGLLQTTGHVLVLTPENSFRFFGGITITGAGWNEEPKTEADILVMHKMVTMDGPLFFGQDDFITGHQLLHKYKWAKYIITGDNHQRFTATSPDNRHLINCGSMMRSNKSQIDYEPKVRIIDTDNWGKMQLIPLNIQPAEEVFNFEKMEREEVIKAEREKANENIGYFIASLDPDEETKPDFKFILSDIMNKTNPGEKVESIINKIMEEIND